MKFLYFTDSHIRTKNPINRKDDFVQTLRDKFTELSSIIKENQVDFVLHGGDLFDRPDLPIPFATEFLKIIEGFSIPFYMISGNHDMFAQNPNTVSKTILGMLSEFDVIHIIEKEDPVYLFTESFKVCIVGTSYFYGIDKDPENYIIRNKPEDVKYLLHLTHGMLLDGGFIEGIDYVSIDHIKETRADITFGAHYHAGFKTIEHEGKYFINPGAMVRLSSGSFDYHRMPKVILVELTDEGIKIEEIPLTCAKKGSEVIDMDKISTYQYTKEILDNFKNLAESTVDFEQMDINNILLSISKNENLDEEISKEAIRRIGQVQMARSESR